jgi:hypothetical protein
LNTAEAQRSCLLVPASPDFPAGRRPDVPGHTLAQAGHHRLRTLRHPVRHLRPAPGRTGRPNRRPNGRTDRPVAEGKPERGRSPEVRPLRGDQGAARRDRGSGATTSSRSTSSATPTSTIEPGRSSSSPARTSRTSTLRPRRSSRRRSRSSPTSSGPPRSSRSNAAQRPAARRLRCHPPKRGAVTGAGLGVWPLPKTA